MENRRDFLKKAGVAGGLGAAGALTLKKEYVKPVVRLLDPSVAYAQTPALSVGGSGVYDAPVMDNTDMIIHIGPWSNTLTITVDLPGGSPPINGSTYNASMSITNQAEPTGWGTLSGLMAGATLTTSTINNVAVGGPGGVVQLSLNVAPIVFTPGPAGTGNAGLPRLNGMVLMPSGFSTAVTALAALMHSPGCVPYVVGGGVPWPVLPGPGTYPAGDRARICINVDADAGSTTGGTAYPAQALGSWCFEMLWS